MTMQQVTRESFFAVVGPLDVHPSITGKWDNQHGYTSHWNLRQSGRTIGYSRGTPAAGQYFVTPEFFKANASRLVSL